MVKQILIDYLLRKNLHCNINHVSDIMVKATTIKLVFVALPLKAHVIKGRNQDNVSEWSNMS